MSHLLHRRRGHDSEGDDDEEGSIVSGMTITDDEYTTSDEDSQNEDDDEETGTDSEYDSSEHETDAKSDQEDEVEQQLPPAVVEASTQEMQQTTGSSSSGQTADAQEQVNLQPTKPSSPSPANTMQTVDMDYQDLQQQQQEKTTLELREYRRKLAEDPSFVPYVGLFWGHDDRYRQDSLATTTTGHHEATREAIPRFSQHTTPSSIKKPSSYDRNLDPLMHKKWDHSGYEELLRLEEQEERQKRELIESGQSPSHIDHHRLPAPRLPRYHHYNNNARGRGGGGGGYRGGHHHAHARNGYSQKRPLNQQQQQQQQAEEWPQLASASDAVDQPISNNNKVDTWGAVDKHKEIKPIDKAGEATDGWKTSTTTATAAEDGWGSAPEPQVVDAASQETFKQDAPKTHTEDQAEHGWGALPESTPTLVESKPESSATADANNWNASPPITTTGWGEQPTIATTTNEGWNNTVTEGEEVSGWSTTEPAPPVETANTTTTATDHKEVDTPAAAAADKPTGMLTSSPSVVTDGWGKPDETPTQDTWSTSNTTQEWHTTPSAPQWDATPANHKTKDNSKSTPLSQHEIPPEEKASSSWANVKLDVPVHTTPSDFTKIDYSHRRRHHSPRRDNNSTYQQQHPQQQATLNQPSMQQHQPKQSSKPTSDSWGADASTTSHAEWHTTKDGVHIESERPPLKSEETTQVHTGYNAKAETRATLSWDATPEAATTATTPFDQSHSSSSFSSSVRGGNNAWNHNSRSSNSANWNADREWNNKMRQEQQQQQQQQQSKMSRGYLSAKICTDSFTAAETASNSTEGFHTPETSAWGHFQSTGDDDSDVEIILEAEEEPEWSKEDEQVLGMTAPTDTETYSPPPHASSNRMTKSYLSHQQHDSGQSSPRPEYNRKSTGATAVNGRHGNNNNNKSHRTGPYDDHWRPPREEAADVYRPIYYPTPVAAHHHHPSYMPMIPNGNGTPMYAMPYPMGPTTTTTSSSSSSPPHMAHHGGDSANSPLHEPSSNTSPHQFYTPSSPLNVVQQQLPPGYEANGMVYYGMDPSAMYAPPQAFYYYAPAAAPPQQQQQTQQQPLPLPQQQHMMTTIHDGYDTSAARRRRPSSLSPRLHLQQAEEDGWGPTPDTVETEEQWRKTTTPSKSSSQQHHDFQNRKQQQQQYYYPQHNNRHHY